MTGGIDALGLGVAEGDPVGVWLALGEGVGEAVNDAVGDGLGEAVGLGVGVLGGTSTRMSAASRGRTR